MALAARRNLYNPRVTEPSARAWTEFGGASLALMGAALAAGARRFARENAAWRREWSRAVGAAEPGVGRDLGLSYRVAGALVAFAGLGVLSAAASGAVAVAPPAHPRLVGALIAFVGAAAAALKLLTRPRGPRFLEGEPLLERSFDERASEAAVWALCALWAAYGLILVSGAPR